MASEYRCILLPWRDVRESLVAYQRKRGIAVPIKAPDAFRIDAGTLNVELEYATSGRPERYRFDRASLTAALILGCKDKGIRLPLKSQKETYLLDDRLALVVHIPGPETAEFLAIELIRKVV